MMADDHESTPASGAEAKLPATTGVISKASSLMARRLNAMTDEYNDRLRELGLDPRNNSVPADHPNAQAAAQALAAYRLKADEAVDRQVEIDTEDIRTSHVPATWISISVSPGSKWHEPPKSLADLREWVAHWRDFAASEKVGVARMTAQQKWTIFQNGNRSLEKFTGKVRAVSNARWNALNFEQKMTALLELIEAAIEAAAQSDRDATATPAVAPEGG
jgi:hypothetical protein